MKLYLGSNRILGGACSIVFGPALSLRLTAGVGGIGMHFEVYGRDGRHLATCEDGRWSEVDPGLEAAADDSTVTLARDGQPLIRLLIRQRFVKLVQADFYGPQGNHVLIGSDGALRLLNSADQPQIEASECEFIGEAHFAEVEVGAIGQDTMRLHGSGVTYTSEAIGIQILSSEFAPSDAAAAMAAAGMSLN